MTILHREPRSAKKRGMRSRSFVEFDEIEWPQEESHVSYYGFEDQILDQLDKLPSPEPVEELCSVLRVATLRQLSSEIVNGGIDHLKQNIDRLEYMKLINSWIATAEETVAAGKNVNRIAARRRKRA